MDIIWGMPGGRQLAMGSYSYDPLIRDFLMISHLAMYSGVSEGALGARPLDRSPVGADRVGGGGVVAPWPPALRGTISSGCFAPGLRPGLSPPTRPHPPGARPSTAHSTFPTFSSSTIRYNQVCGFDHFHSFTTPVNVLN